MDAQVLEKCLEVSAGPKASELAEDGMNCPRVQRQVLCPSTLVHFVLIEPTGNT